MTTSIVKILRGIPGAGKTHYVNDAPNAVALSADDFWIGKETGEYRFDPLRIGEAHADCFCRFLTEITVPEYELIIVDNTNIRSYEIAPYVLAATAHGLAHEIVTVWCDPVIAAARCVHKVPVKVVLKMYADLLKEELPPFWNHTVLIPGFPEGGGR